MRVLNSKKLLYVIIVVAAVFTVALGIGFAISRADKIPLNDDGITLSATDNECAEPTPPITTPTIHAEQPTSEVTTILLQGIENTYAHKEQFPQAVTIRESDIFVLYSLSDGTELCWYVDNERQYENGAAYSCAYKKQGGSWIWFLAENSNYAQEHYNYGFGEYENLFGHSGFFIIAARGTTYVAHDYYYFDTNGDLKLLIGSTSTDIIGDFNDDGENELIWFRTIGDTVMYYYRNGESIYEVDVLYELSAYCELPDMSVFAVDWEESAQSVLSNELRIYLLRTIATYPQHEMDKTFFGTASFTVDGVAVEWITSEEA